MVVKNYKSYVIGMCLTQLNILLNLLLSVQTCFCLYWKLTIIWTSSSGAGTGQDLYLNLCTCTWTYTNNLFSYTALVHGPLHLRLEDKGSSMCSQEGKVYHWHARPPNTKSGRHPVLIFIHCGFFIVCGCSFPLRACTGHNPQHLIIFWPISCILFVTYHVIFLVAFMPSPDIMTKVTGIRDFLRHNFDIFGKYRVRGILQYQS